MALMDDGPIVVELRGEHDISTVVALTDELLEVSTVDKSDIVLDLSALTFMDASTVSVIVHLHVILRGQSRRLALRSPSAFARHVIDMCGIAEFLEDRTAVSTAGAAALSTWVEVPTTSSHAADSDVAPQPEALPDPINLGTR